MLFHGTSCDTAVGILEKGFNPSTKGKYGPGVYLTKRSRCAIEYSVVKNCEFRKTECSKNYTFNGETLELLNKKENIIFVNEILESETLKEINISYDIIKNLMLQLVLIYVFGLVVPYIEFLNSDICSLFTFSTVIAF